MTPIGEHHLLSLVKRHRQHLWIGIHPPFEFDNVFLPGCTNYRAPASMHRKYDVVWSHEPDIATFPPEAIPLYLDELTRFIGEEGRIVFRYSQSSEFTIVQLKRHLGRHPMLAVEIEYESEEKGLFHTVFRVQRKELAAYASDLWTFSILTLGTRKPNVLRYLESIRKNDPDRRHEILICGPRAAEYEPFGVRYNDRQYSTKFTDICAKKNDLAEMASHPNLLIAHDRYKLDDNFFAGFDDYGYDFDFVSMTQWYECHTQFPAYVTLSKESHRFAWQPPIILADVNRVYPLTFLNGGLLAFKTHTLRRLPFNELLFWNQAEDCDLSRWMLDNSLPPRFNSFSSATVLGLTPAYTSKFVREHEKKNGTAATTKEAEVPPPPPPVGLTKRVRKVVGRPVRVARKTVSRHYRKLAAAGLAVTVASQVAILYLLLNGQGR